MSALMAPFGKPPTSQALKLRLCACFAAAWACLSSSGAELRIGDATISAGTAVRVPVTSQAAVGGVAAQFDLSYNPSVVSLAGISSGDAMAGHVVDQHELAPGHWRALVYSTTNNPIASGTLLWLNFNVPPNTPDGVVPLTLANTIVAQTNGQRVQPLVQVSGELTVSSPQMS